ncbi:MAG: hypothetical protein QOJ35_220 [Solirubrobacteraceae bacterium]|jgi:GGDEF domain-containing protein|nr:hypothetical protein [Solirubrobacteraceae bacterium]
MAYRTSDDGSVGSGHGTIGRQQQDSATATARDVPAVDGVQTARALLTAAEERAAAANERDLAARSRDAAAAARDRDVATLEQSEERFDRARARTESDLVVQAVGRRRRAEAGRAAAAEHRALAALDREAAARDRECAARERVEARADRETLARLQALGVPHAQETTRTPVLRDLERELARCRRFDDPLVLAYVDLVGGDPRGGAATSPRDDARLGRAIALTAAQLRAYDVIVRLGPAAFLCALPDMTLSEAIRRFVQIDAALAGAPEAGTIRTGLAELRSGESSTELIARAASDLVRSGPGG